MTSSWHLSARGDSLALALAVAIGVHVVAIGLVHFDLFTGRPDKVPTALDVILVQWANETPPDEADFLAQASQRGGGDSPDLKRPAEPVPSGEVLPDQQPEPIQELAQEQTIEQTPSELVAVEAADDALPEPTPSEMTRNDPVDSRELIQQSLAVARASPDRLAETQDFPNRLRRKFISANTREHLYAGYMRSWVSKVERVGNLNYPEQARRMNLDGALVLSVDVLPDGSVEQIRVLRSSGYDILDEAAVRIVRLSAPFAPLPPEITREVDVLTITRTWQFSARSGLY
ncbi:energy transducer TonB [Wenzhouxiangella marina]|uniref:Energy transducer TonB n=1 Tax=Wenzhouxiangella marina TaxID=1579979 RepID=A0A0K0XT06_9GAMM|nr:energy transducer TonB [Wenzhouxiangella marina]AKS40751.1 energy transducer TonB [Wenzhouxiangella marina]MBB6087624.1 protein TonB [Wenzhouxiangella marina]